MTERPELNQLHNQALNLVQKMARENKVPILSEYIHLPNKPDIGPEVLSLKLRYGDTLREVSDAVEAMRKNLGVDYDTVRQAIINCLD